MLTDEQIIQRIRSELHRELAEVHPPDSFLDHLWEQAETAKAKPERSIVRRFGASYRFGIRAGALSTLTAVAVTLVILVGGLILLGGAHHPPTPTVAPSAQPLTNILAVLRRPQTNVDHDPALLQRPPFRLSRLQGKLGTPEPALIRLATITPWGAKVFLVPMKPPTKAALAKLPPLQRAFAEQQQARDGRSDRLGVFTVGNGGGGTCCADAHAIQQAGAAMWGGTSLITWLVLVVPDGVAKVTVLLPRQEGPGARVFKRSLSLTARVHNNVVAIEIDRVVDDPLHYMIWYGQTGNFVKKFGNTHNLNRVILRTS
ncbi:MAG: hypothetical protein WAN22_05955 [Solirubrobacteraceae bacterium]